MTVGLLLLDCFIPGSHSLKEKRSVLKSTIERLKRRHNVSVCEYEDQDKWQRARLAVVLVNTEWRHAQSSFTAILRWLEKDRRLTILDAETSQVL